MKNGNRPLNLSMPKDLTAAAEAFIAVRRRKGRRNLSEWTTGLWIAHLRKQGVKLPDSAALKPAAAPRQKARTTKGAK